jgi:FSR family fosmidomycin resistance protein-like MFS transporter
VDQQTGQNLVVLHQHDVDHLRQLARGALAALRRREVGRWLALLEASNLLLDVFHGFLAVYLVDQAGAAPALAAATLLGASAIELLGQWLLPVLLRQLEAERYLRRSAIAALVVYPLLLLAPGIAPKLALLAVLTLLTSGWYPLLKSRLYAALPETSGAAMALSSLAGTAAAPLPLLIGALAAALGLQAAMWPLLAGALALVVLVPRPASRSDKRPASASGEHVC